MLKREQKFCEIYLHMFVSREYTFSDFARQLSAAPLLISEVWGKCKTIVPFCVMGSETSTAHATQLSA